MTPDLFASQDPYTVAAVALSGVSFLFALIRALFRAIGGKKGE